MEEKEKEKLLHFYCDNEMHNLKEVSIGVLKRLGRNGDNDLDEFFSIANLELFKAIKSYNPDNEWGASFNTFLSGNLIRKFQTEITKRTRQKRFNGTPLISLDEQKSGLDEIALIDTIASNLNVENEIIGETSDNVNEYLKTLSPKQKQLAEYIMDGYTIGEATNLMHLSKTDVDNMLKFMRSYEKRKVFDGNIVISDNTIKGEKAMKVTGEKSKTTKYSVDELYRKISNKTINLEHPLQRASGQWDNKTKSNLISDLIQDNPIPSLILAEQIIDGNSIKFNLDGKQRCTTVKEYIEDAFKISKNVTRSIITYQHISKDKNGHAILNEKGYPVMENVEFDISNKKFSQLPPELQDKIKEYNFDITLYLNCSDEDIAYHIQRYNQGKPMNIVQKGFTYLGEDFAREIKAIASMPLFQDSSFTFKQFNNGSINRVIIESVMAINFLDDWKKSPEEISMYLNKNATMEMFESIEDSINRLQDIVTDETIVLFDMKNTFIWLTLFERFKTFKIDDCHFNDFLISFINELQYKKINGNTYVSIDDGKNTKDKSVLIAKINHLEMLLKDFLFGQDDLAS